MVYRVIVKHCLYSVSLYMFIYIFILHFIFISSVLDKTSEVKGRNVMLIIHWALL